MGIYLQRDYIGSIFPCSLLRTRKCMMHPEEIGSAAISGAAAAAARAALEASGRVAMLMVWVWVVQRV